MGLKHTYWFSIFSLPEGDFAILVSSEDLSVMLAPGHGPAFWQPLKLGYLLYKSLLPGRTYRETIHISIYIPREQIIHILV